jgi:hypothetical protein
MDTATDQVKQVLGSMLNPASEGSLLLPYWSSGARSITTGEGRGSEVKYQIHVQLSANPVEPGKRFHACAHGMPEYHAYGDTVEEAIGNLILGYSTRLGMRFTLSREVKGVTGYVDSSDTNRSR